MEVIVGVVMVVALGIMGWFPLWADMSDRFSLARQVQNQKTCIVLYNVGTRELKLVRWVVALASSAVALLLLAAVSVARFMAENAKGYWGADEAMQELSFVGMIVASIGAIFSVYHMVGMIVRLRAWRQVLAGLSAQVDDDGTVK